jgi:hypothetical protein
VDEIGGHLVVAGPAPRELTALDHGDHAEQGRPQAWALRLGKPLIDAVGRQGDSPVDAPGLLVAAQGQRPL